MARLTDTRTAPPGGWRYVQPETGADISAMSLPELVERVQQHRRYMRVGSVELSDLIGDIERQLCGKLEPRFCRAEPGEVHEPIVDLPGGLTASRVAAGTIAFVAFLKGGGKIVDKAESGGRAKICRGCPYNRNADGCGACNVLYSAIEAGIPKDRREPDIRSCAVCGCALKAKVLMPREVLNASIRPGTRFPAHCWAKAN